MKLKFLLSLAAAAAALNAVAQNTIDVYRKDGTVLTLNVSELDSLVFNTSKGTPSQDGQPGSGSGTQTEYEYDTLAANGTPVVYMVYNEFAPDGGWLKVRGRNLSGNSLQVSFKDKSGKDLVSAGSSNVKIVGSDGTEAWFRVPVGTGHTFKPVIKDLGSGKQSTFPIVFRDRSNILCDFDNNLQWTDAVGSYSKAKDGTWDVFAQPADPSVISNIDNNFACDLKGNNITKNQFALFDQLGINGSWCGYNVMADSSLASGQDLLNNCVFRNLTSDIIAGKVRMEDLAVKFEVNISLMKGPAVLYIGFSSGQVDDPLSQAREWCAALNMGEVLWYKGDPKGWIADTVGTPSSDGWMTVTVPLTEMYLNICHLNYGSVAEDITKGQVSYRDEFLYGNGRDNTPYVWAHPLTSAADAVKYYGSLSIMDCPWGASWYTTAQKNVRFAIDNIRIVRNDGNGAVYPYTNWGVPSQHFVDKPRTIPFGTVSIPDGAVTIPDGARILTVGGSLSTAGSFISVKDGKVYGPADAAAKAGSIEIVFKNGNFVSAAEALNADLVAAHAAGTGASAYIYGSNPLNFFTSTGYDGSITVLSGDLSDEASEIKIALTRDAVYRH